MHTAATILKKQGTSEERIKIMLWEYYRRAKTVELITEYAQIYKHYGRINLEGNAFPLLFAVTIATVVHSALEEALEEEEFMKELIFLQAMAYQ